LWDGRQSVAQRINVSLDELHEMERRIEQRRLKDGDWRVVGALVSSFVDRQEARIQRMLDKSGTSDVNETGCEGAQDSGGSACSPQPGETQPEGKPSSEDKAKGHGRNGASAFTNARRLLHHLAAGVVGALCEACNLGRMTKYRDKVVVRVVGQPLFAVELHHAEQARCRICGCIVTAALPDGIDDGIGKAVTYHWTACATLLVMHYFAAMPLKRLESLHESWGIPFADSNQWEMIEGAMKLLWPLSKALEAHAVQNMRSFQIDDTGSQIIELKRQIEAELLAAKTIGLLEQSVRQAINATCAYVETAQGKIILFYTGRHHAGEIIDALLKKRPSTAEKAIKVSDAASKNFDHDQGDKLIEGVCNAHAFLKFRAVKDQFPAEYALVGEAYKNVFENDAHALTLKMSPDDRLAYHKKHSEPWMKKIRRLCQDKIRERRVEPRSPLWEPVTFIINQWPRLVEFLNTPGVPIHTNVVEQTLIIPVRYLAASFNFKTQTGADAGDEAMALIVTARANGVEPVAYLTHCLENHKDLKLNPQKYLPWVYREAIKERDIPPETPPEVVKEAVLC
jgi:transposase